VSWKEETLHEEDQNENAYSITSRQIYTGSPFLLSYFPSTIVIVCYCFRHCLLHHFIIYCIIDIVISIKLLGGFMLAFSLSSQYGMPAYQQLMQQVKRALLLGMVQVGDQLPTVREVVGTLTLNPNTVLKAYHELEMEGIVESRPGAGTFIIQVPSPIAPVLLARLQRGVQRWLSEARAEELDDISIEAIFYDALHRNSQDQAV